MATASSQRETSADERRRALLWGGLLLVALVVAVYGQTRHFDFVEFDDGGYVNENPYVRAGLTAEGVRWALTTTHMWNWHPVTWLSLMLDVQLFGVDPGALHLVNVAFHLANALLLFALLEQLTRAPWASLIVAALFAVHPLHVESVAWISERKDVLSAFWFLLALWSYVRYVAARSWRWYVAALVTFALGLLTKAMLVTVPFVLLLLDVWPLGRWQWGERAAVTRAARGRRERARIPPAGGSSSVRWTALVWEKLPFFALSVAASVFTYFAQASQGAVEQSGVLPVHVRIANALIAYARYLVMTVWPTDLAVFYPYETDLPFADVVVAALGLGAVSALAVAALRRRPYVSVGWFLYLGMLVPVIGLVQVGSQALADRYTYLPLIGIFIAATWLGRSAVESGRLPARVATGVAIAVIGAYTVAARGQVSVWRNGLTLLAHAARVTGDNYLAHNNLGAALEGRGAIDAAIEQYREALRIKPDYEHARANLAHALRGRYESAVAADPDDAAAHVDLANALRDGGQPLEALPHYEEAIRLRPDDGRARAELGGLLATLGRPDEAVEQLREAVRLLPGDAATRFNLGSALARAGRMTEAVEQYRQVVSLTPDDPEAWGNLAMAHAALEEDAAAGDAYRKAVELARAQANWSLVKTLEDWFSTYQAGSRATGASN